MLQVSSKSNSWRSNALLKNVKIQQKLNHNPQDIIHCNRSRKYIDKIFEERKKRKSFCQFIDQNNDNLYGSLIKINAKRDFSTLVVSYDNKVKPIHIKFSTIKAQKNYNKLLTKQYRPAIYKAQRHSKQKQRERRLSQWAEELAQCHSIKSVKKPLIPKQIRFYTQENLVKFDCRPWTRRGQREQNEQQEGESIEQL